MRSWRYHATEGAVLFEDNPPGEDQGWFGNPQLRSELPQEAPKPASVAVEAPELVDPPKRGPGRPRKA